MPGALSPSAEIHIEPVAPGTEYRVSIQWPGVEAVTREIRLGQRVKQWMETGSTTDPLELAFEQIGIHKFSYSRRINLFLPDDPVAGLNWENLRRGHVFRCTPRDDTFRRSPITGPLRVGFVSTIPTTSKVYSGLASAIRNLGESGELDVQLLDVPDGDSLDEEVRAHGFQAIHVLVKTDLTPDGPRALIGGEYVPLEQVVRDVAQPGIRFVVLQDASENPRAMAALRWGAQSLPSNSEASVLLWNAPPLDSFLDAMKEFYGSLLQDEPLVSCVAHLGPESEHGRVSLVTHSGTERGLGLRQEIGLGRRQYQQIQADLNRLTKPMRGMVDVGLHQFVPRASTIGNEAEAPLSELLRTVVETREAEGDLEERVKKLITETDPDQPRYPAAWFYEVDAATKTAIPDTKTLAWPQPVGIGLEFHFWLDIVKAGITSVSETPSINRPERVPYPLTLLVTVWSEDFEFVTHERPLILQAAGPTEHAIFPIKNTRSPPWRAELFVFLRHEGTLIAAFRVEADITEQSETKQGAQTIEHAYLASDWFRFDKAPTASALTVFVTKKHGYLQIFTLKPKGNPWAALGPTETGLYDRNKEIYKEVQALAHRADQAVRQNKSFKFSTEAKRLAGLGYQLFGDIFLLGEEDAGAFADEYLRGLPEGSTLTIAIGRDAQNLYIPWGLLYDRQPPYTHFDVPRLEGFLGYRYNLVVRPSTPHDGPMPKRQLPVRMGAAWLEHEETKKLRAFYKPYEDAKKLVIEPIRAEEHSLPALANETFDLVEFFCHGHTKLSGVFSDEEVQEHIATYAASTPGKEKNSLQMAIDATVGDTLLDLSGGFVTLAGLGDSLKRSMPGRPLIFLSMCESAQVSAGGTGFVPFFLRRGARAVIGTEGPTLWSLSREMDTTIVAALLEGKTISQAFYGTRKNLAKTNMLALIYTLYGDGDAGLV